MKFLKAAFRTAKKGWMTFAHTLGWVNSRILLTALYIIVIGPYAVARGVGSLFRRSPSRTSYWLPRAHEEPTLETLRRIF
jgi:hypothetical protein